MSGMQMPEVAPASMAMLQRVMRDSIVVGINGAATELDCNPVSGAVDADHADQGQHHILGIHALGSSPVTFEPNGLGLTEGAALSDTISRSVVPTPAANAPNAPWVQVWESPIVPCCGRVELPETGVTDAVGAHMRRSPRCLAAGQTQIIWPGWRSWSSWPG